MKILRKNQKRKPLVWDKWQTLLSSSRNSAFLRHAVRINDEHERDQLLEKEPRIALNPHQPPAGDMHEDIPEIATSSLFRKQVGPDEEPQHESDFQPLIDGSDTTEVVEAVAESERDTDECEVIEPAWRILGCAAKCDDETQHHCRSTARFYRSRNPITPTDEDDYPRRQTNKVHRPRSNPPLPRSHLVTPIARVFREREKDLVEEVEPSSKPLQYLVQGLPPFVLKCALPRPLAWQRLPDYMIPRMLKDSILRHKSQEAASAASWVCLKNFSFLLSLKTWFEPIVFSGSLAFLKSRGEAAPNSRGVSRRRRRRNAFGLIQEYCTTKEIASLKGSPRFARRLICIGFWGQKRVCDFERRKEKIFNP
ncbi:MAG: hypothetical protein HYV66_01905 [Candidatus Sungbacteria bacterium]|uniref:Uncharacterized protein n=1 Tax=Candidatus Sungiibacteriota bacterium TaxID=2750080 RepID=A0A931YDJ5_9BACT|nr:hypothetical protein [Candidatus Sungbacteria bacterium]